jgi:Tfp pilus assembly protein PilE
MRKEVKNYVKHRKAFTLIELILAAAMTAILVAALVGIIYNSYRNWRLGGGRSTLLQDGRAAMEQMARIIRQAKSFTSVSLSTDTAGQITFTDANGIIRQFRRNASTNEIEYGLPGSVSALVGSVSSLVFTCYDVNADSLADPVQVRNIRGVGITATLTDSVIFQQFTLSDRVFCQETPLNSLVINEIMYNPAGGGSDSPKEWVELYNLSDSPVDVNGWSIWTDAQGNADLLISHPVFGNGSTIIPIGGYAAATASTTSVYTELLTNGNFEAANISAWVINPGASWSRTTGGAHGGTQKLESTASGATTVYQQITIPSGYSSYLFLFWEKTTAPAAQTQITATIRNMSDAIMATGYSGQMNSNWTCHTMNVGAYAGQTVRIYFAANKTASGSLYLDDISTAYSYVGINAIRLGVPDDEIGNGLANTTDTVAIVSGNSTVDSVSYANTWGGNGDGTSLSRVSPQGPSNQQSNWTSGHINGTPGRAN